MELFLFAGISRRWGDWGHIRNEKKAELLSAPTLAHHTLQSMQTALTRTCGKTRGNRQKETHLQTHTPVLSLRSGGSQQESQSVRLFSPPPQLLFFQAAMSGWPCHLFSMLWNTELPLASGLPQGGKNVWWSFTKKMEKQEEKVSRSESGCGSGSHLGPVSCLVTHVLILRSAILCASVWPSSESSKWAL